MTIATEELRKLVSEATPGPWSIGDEKNKKDGSAWTGIDGPLWTGLARVWSRMSGENEDAPDGLANARLIALTPTLAAELITARAKGEAAEKIKAAYEELLATVQGECPSLVNEDSGGSQVLINCVLDAEEAIAAWKAAQ